MTRAQETTLVPEPHLAPEEGTPYERLNRHLAGIQVAEVEPTSPARLIKDVWFDVMRAGRPPDDVRAAWDELRKIEQRLCTDFFMYEVAAEDVRLDDAGWWDAMADLPMPLPEIDPLALAPAVDPAEAVPDPGVIDPAPLPAPIRIPARMIAVPPLDLGPLAPTRLPDWTDDER